LKSKYRFARFTRRKNGLFHEMDNGRDRMTAPYLCGGAPAPSGTRSSFDIKESQGGRWIGCLSAEAKTKVEGPTIKLWIKAFEIKGGRTSGGKKAFLRQLLLKKTPKKPLGILGKNVKIQAEKPCGSYPICYSYQHISQE
jgi:hypothetical protein